MQLEEFLARHIGPLLKTCSPLMKNVQEALAKSDMVLLRLTASVSTEDAVMHKKLLNRGQQH